MFEDVITARQDTPRAGIAAILERRRTVAFGDAALIGVASRANLIQALASAAVESTEKLDQSRRMGEELLSHLEAQPWTDFGSRNVIVADRKIQGALSALPAERKSRSLRCAGCTASSSKMIPAYSAGTQFRLNR